MDREPHAKRNALPHPLQAANNAARLCAVILKLTKDIDRLDHWALRDRLNLLRKTAEQMRDEGKIPDGPIRLILYEDGIGDYELATNEGPED